MAPCGHNIDMFRLEFLPRSGVVVCCMVALVVMTDLTGCGQLVSNDFRVRLWERFSANGHRAMSQQDFKTAAQMFQNASEESTVFAKNDLRVLRTLANLGWARVLVAQYSAASLPLTQALHRSEKLLPTAQRADKESLYLIMTKCLVGLGEIARNANEPRQAEKFYQKAIATFDEAGINVERGYDSIGTVLTVAYHELSKIQLGRGSNDEGRKSLARAAAISDITIGAMKLKADMRSEYVELLFYQGEIDKGIKLSNRLWSRMIRAGVKSLEASKLNDARDHFTDAEQVAATESGDSTMQAVSCWYLAQLSAKQGQSAAVRQYSLEGLKLRQSQRVDSKDFLTRQFESFLNQPS